LGSTGAVASHYPGPVKPSGDGFTGSDPSGIRCGPAVDEQYNKQLLSNPTVYQSMLQKLLFNQQPRK